MEIVESPRPDTQEDGDRIMLRAYREALTEISYILDLPGSPDLVVDVVKEARKVRIRDLERLIPQETNERRRGWLRERLQELRKDHIR